MLLIIWLRFQYVSELITAKNIKNMTIMIYQKTLMHKWVIHVSKKNSDFVISAANDYFNQLVFLLCDLSCLWALLLIVVKQMFEWKEKMIVWCLFLDQQIYVVIVMHLCDINVKIFFTDFSQWEHEKMIWFFMTDCTATDVLICSYSINSFSINLQQLCHNVYLFEMIMFESVVMQAIDWVCCLNQTYVVKVYNYCVLDSFNMWQIVMNLSKTVLEMIVELNKVIFNVRIDDAEDNILLECWERTDDDHLIFFIKAEENDDSFNKEQSVIFFKDDMIMIIINIMKRESLC